MALVVTANTSLALFQLFIDYGPPAGTQVSATIYRSLFSTGPWEELRTVDLLGQQAYQFDNTGPFGVNVWYRTVADDGTEFIAGPTQIPVGPEGAAWLRDPGRPWADREMFFCENPEAECNPTGQMSWVGFGTFGRPTDASLFEIHDAEKPADVWARRKNLSTEINFFTNTLTLREQVYELFTAGGPLFLVLPPVYGWDDEFIQTTADLTEDYISRDQRKPWRRWSAPVRTVDRPQGPIQGSPCANWCEVNGAFATYADLTASGATWGDVADGSLICEVPGLTGYGEGLYGDGPYGDGG